MGAPLKSNSTRIWFVVAFALMGMLLLIFSIGNFLLNSTLCQDLNGKPSKGRSLTGGRWWVGALVTILFPITLYTWLWISHGKGILKAGAFWPQQINSVIIF